MRVAFLLALVLAAPATAAAADFSIGQIDGPLQASVEAAIKRAAKGKANIRSGASVTVNAKIERDGRRWRVTVEVADSSGSVQKKWIVRAKRPRRAAYLIEKGFWRKMGGVIERLAPDAAPPEPPPAAPPPPAAGPPPPFDPTPPPPVAPPAAPTTRSGPAQVVILKTTKGRPSKRVEKAILAALDADDRYELTARAGVQEAGDLGSTAGRIAVARTLGITAWLDIDARYRRRRFRVTLRVLDGATGEEQETTDIVARNRRKLAAGIAAALGRILPQTSIPAPLAPPPAPPPARPPPAAPPPPVAAASTVEEEVEVPRDPSAMNGAMVIARLDFHMFSRALSYNDDLFGELRPYKFVGAPAVGGAATWFVGEAFTRDWWRHLALDVSGHYGFALASENSDGQEFPTSSIAWDVGAYGRLPLGVHEIGALIGIGGESFSISDAADGTSADVPPVSYVTLRFGGRFRFFVTDEVSIRGEGAYRLVAGAGGIADDTWFPRASVGAADAQLGVTYDIGVGFFADAGFAMRRYFYTLNPEPGDPFIAGGAADQYFIGNVGIGWYH